MKALWETDISNRERAWGTNKLEVTHRLTWTRTLNYRSVPRQMNRAKRKKDTQLRGWLSCHQFPPPTWAFILSGVPCSLSLLYTHSFWRWRWLTGVNVGGVAHEVSSISLPSLPITYTHTICTHSQPCTLCKIFHAHVSCPIDPKRHNPPYVILQ